MMPQVNDKRGSAAGRKHVSWPPDASLEETFYYNPPGNLYGAGSLCLLAYLQVLFIV